MRRVRILVVDDSAVQRQMLCRLFAQDPELEVVGWAANGAEALRAVTRLKPDIVTLDDCMPVMGGLEAARHIMRETPTPIVMVSSATGAEARTLEQAALAAGVLAVQDKRALALPRSPALDELMRLVKGMAAVRLVRRRRDPAPAIDPQVSPPDDFRMAPEVVAMGASTGGPQALREILSHLPASYPLPILVVQHTTAGSLNNLAEWLQIDARLPVRIAQDGVALDHSGVYVAPTERHLMVQGRRMTLIDGAPVSLHRPSVTVLFRSIAAAFGARSIGILLTGMGDDGAAGLIDVKRAGGVTIAQDEATSVVFGMPAEAVRLGAADHVLSPAGIVALLTTLSTRARSAA